MYQRVIRTQFEGRIPLEVVNCNETVNGSTLIVPADTRAFLVLNGHLSEPYSEGRYDIDTGVHPLFVRWRNLMTQGDPGITFSVFFINTKVETTNSGGTGEIIFNEKRFKLTTKAKAGYAYRFSIEEPKIFIEKLVGFHRTSFNEDNLIPAVNSMIGPTVKETIARYLTSHAISEFQNELKMLSRQIGNELVAPLRAYGIKLSGFSVMGVTIPDAELARLKELEKKYAEGITSTDIEKDNLERVYDNNIEMRTMAEMATGTARGNKDQTIVTNANGAMGNMGALMASIPMQMAMANAMSEQFRNGFSSMLGGTNLAGANTASAVVNSPTTSNAASSMVTSQNNVTNATQNQANAAPRPMPGQRNAVNVAPRPMPGQAGTTNTRTRICTNCHRTIGQQDVFCKFCGTRQ